MMACISTNSVDVSGITAALMLADALALAAARKSVVALKLDAARMLNDLWALGGF